jgi:hypothetical protein
MNTLDTSALKFTTWWYEDSIKSYWWSKFGVVEGDNTIIYLTRWIFGVVEGNVAIVKVMWPLIGPILDTYIVLSPLTTPNFFRLMPITANRKSSVCVENMTTAGRIAASSGELGKCTYRHTIWSFLGCPPTKMATNVLLTEQRTKSDTFMTTV